MAVPSKDLIKLADVPALLLELAGVTRTKATVYLWANKGRPSYAGKRIKLQTTRKIGTLYTTREWVENFLRGLNR